MTSDVLLKISLIVPTKINYEILNIKVNWKYYTSFVIQNVIFFRPHWLKPFSNWSKYNAKLSLNTKWRQISMECFPFFEQRFPRICLNKVPSVSVEHFISSIPDYRHINSQQFLQSPVTISIFHRESFGGVTSRNDCGIPLRVRLLQRMTSYFWCFLVGALSIY